MVTDSRLSRQGVLSDVERALDAGCTVVQYREKEKCTRDMVTEALRLLRLALVVDCEADDLLRAEDVTGKLERHIVLADMDTVGA